jgi:Prenyltransferase and squalene oxidase repeat
MSIRHSMVFVAVFVATCVPTVAARSAPVPARKPHHQLRTAITRGLAIVQKGARNYPKHRKCYSCHHQTFPLLAMTEAKDAGFGIDERLAKDIVGFTRKSFRDRIGGLKKGTGIGGRAMTVGYGLWTFRLAGEKPDDVTEAMVAFLEKTQETRGRWAPQAHRPPLEESRITVTLLSLYGMQKYGTASQTKAVKTAEGRALKWLATVKPKSHEDRVMLLWAKSLFGGSKAEIADARKAVLAAQKPDGGWAQLDGMQSDAYATGQTLWVLLRTMSPFAPRKDAGRSNRERTGEIALSRSERRQCATAIRKGVEFLLKTQQADGSWFVKTRSRPVQIYFDNGDPHGKSQFISIAATGWAMAALAGWLAEQ